MTERKITKVLIANRGEIAVRVIRAAKDSGIQTVAVYADGDRNAQHVRLADEAHALNGETAAETYLVIEKILSIAKRSKSNAIRPGYGFLSENADFAQAVRTLESSGLDQNQKRYHFWATRSLPERLPNQLGPRLLPEQ